MRMTQHTASHGISYSMTNIQSWIFPRNERVFNTFFPFCAYALVGTSVVVSMHSHFAFRCIFHRFGIIFFFFFYLSKINIHHRKSSSIFSSAVIAFMHLIEITLLRKLRWRYETWSKKWKINKLQNGRICIDSNNID